MKPLAVDLCAGLGGWAEGLLVEGWDVVGFDIERHVYGEMRYPAQLVLQDIRTLDGRQFRGKVGLIVASPPCQKYSYMAMPWTRAKALAQWYRDAAHPERLVELNELFNACRRIGREAECPIVIENVCGAQPWVGRADWRFGSFYLWGDVPALMPVIRRAIKGNGGPWFKDAESADGAYGPGNFRVNIEGAHNTTSGKRQNPDGRGVKVSGDWFGSYAAQKAAGTISPGRLHGKGSPARKAASAQIAKIPLPLACHIARAWKPDPSDPVGRGRPTP